MKTNLGALDRATRQVVGIMMLALAFSGVVPGLLGDALFVLGIALVLTGTVGYCWIYRRLGWSTAHRSGGGALTSP